MCQLYEITVKGITNVFAFVVSFFVRRLRSAHFFVKRKPRDYRVVFVLQKEVAVSNVNLRQPLFDNSDTVFIALFIKLL